MPLGTVRTVLASAARTTTGSTAAFGLAEAGAERVAVGVSVTAVSGVSPTLDVALQWSHDGGTTWLPAQSADSFTQVTAAAGAVKVFEVKGPLFRVAYTVAGTTPSFTFSVTAVGL